MLVINICLILKEIAIGLLKYFQHEDDIDAKLRKNRYHGNDPFKFLKNQYKKEYEDLLSSKSKDKLIKRFNKSLGRYINYLSSIRHKLPSNISAEVTKIIIERDKVLNSFDKFDKLENFPNLENMIHTLMICGYKAKSIFTVHGYENRDELIEYDLPIIAKSCLEIYEKYDILSAKELNDLILNNINNNIPIKIEELENLFNDVIQKFNEATSSIFKKNDEGQNGKYKQLARIRLKEEIKQVEKDLVKRFYYVKNVLNDAR